MPTSVSRSLGFTGAVEIGFDRLRRGLFPRICKIMKNLSCKPYFKKKENTEAEIANDFVSN